MQERVIRITVDAEPRLALLFPEAPPEYETIHACVEYTLRGDHAYFKYDDTHAYGLVVDK